jgi:hypothetical protein
MGAAVGAALKKIAVAIFTDPKVLKKVGGIVLGIIIIICMPIVAVVSIFNGDVNIDTDKLNTSIQQALTEEQNEKLKLYNDTMEKIENKLKDKHLSKFNTLAEVIYLFALSDKSKDNNFVNDYVSCFKKNYSNEEVVNAVNSKFGTDIKSSDVEKMVKSAGSSNISLSGYYDPKVKNNLDLAQWCRNAQKNGWGYVYGGYGQLCTVAYLDQQAAAWPGANEAGGPMRTVGEKWLGKRVTDCIGLIKSYAWYNPSDGSIKPGANGFSDCSASSIWGSVTESGEISSIPEVEGLGVWMPGHIGVYVGKGEVIEAMGTAYGVVKTKVAGRGWHKWLRIPHIQYVKKQEAKKENKKDNDSSKVKKKNNKPKKKSKKKRG